ncbi:Isocitrate dehydrogenase [Nesidiocoris tenuis]|uniref:Isocitrate dehydrogenase n=1 Tax=Nesidiocoris tenuis TaxID=355587 RepID=A0ABN7B1U4_9HEMI|nr:Isocitrate dehydrogenase [Nesidiocoris tenuis]
MARPVKVPAQVAESAHPFFDPWFLNSPRGPQPRTKTGSKHTLTVIPGVGIGREMIDAVLDVFSCCGAPLSFEWIDDVGTVDALENMKMSLSRNGVAIKGNIENRSTKQIVQEDTESWNFLLIEALDLFVHVTLLKSFRGLKSQMRVHDKMDIIVIRSNTEGEFSLLEHQPTEGVFEHLRVITAYNTKRVAEFAFRLAEESGRKKVTLLHQSEIMPMSEGLFVDEFLKVAMEHPTIGHDVLNIHNAVHQIFENIGDLDVILSNSIYCSQLVDILTGMIGSPRLVAGGSFSNRFAIFEPAVNSRSRAMIAKNEANPTGFLLSGAYALKFLGYPEMADIIREGIEVAFEAGVKTKDLNGSATTDEFISQIVKHIRTEVPRVLCKHDKPPDFKPKTPENWAPQGWQK